MDRKAFNAWCSTEYPPEFLRWVSGGPPPKWVSALLGDGPGEEDVWHRMMWEYRISRLAEDAHDEARYIRGVLQFLLERPDG